MLKKMWGRVEASVNQNDKCPTSGLMASPPLPLYQRNVGFFVTDFS